MSEPESKPDLDESINVTEAHGRLVREAAACAREKRIGAEGNESAPLWILGICGLVAVIAGGILGNAGNRFSYTTLVRDGYVRKAAPGQGTAGPEPKEALAAFVSRGTKIYTAKCNGCHGADAKGDGANYPSLAGSAWVNGETERFAMVILNGLQGATSTGKAYSAPMPPQGAGLSPEDLAAVMTYVRNSFGNSTGDVVTPEMAKAAMDISGKRAKAGQMATAAELEADHLRNLPGAPLDPKTMVDPKTLLPVAEAKP